LQIHMPSRLIQIKARIFNHEGHEEHEDLRHGFTPPLGEAGLTQIPTSLFELRRTSNTDFFGWLGCSRLLAWFDTSISKLTPSSTGQQVGLL